MALYWKHSAPTLGRWNGDPSLPDEISLILTIGSWIECDTGISEQALSGIFYLDDTLLLTLLSDFD